MVDREKARVSRALALLIAAIILLWSFLAFAPPALADSGDDPDDDADDVEEDEDDADDDDDDDDEDDDKDEKEDDEDGDDDDEGPDRCTATPGEEVGSSAYESMPYWKVGPTLCEIEEESDRVRVETIGQSAGGRDLFLVTVAEPPALRNLDDYLDLQQTMVDDPGEAIEAAQEMDDFKVPVYVHASIHGDEYPGVDASIDLIERFAFSDDPEVLEILDKLIILINVVANPDGRVLGTRANENGFDLNRDFVTLSQPETRAAVGIITEWNPLWVLDLHGFVDPYLIEPTTAPHNPSYEYDLYLKWALPQAFAMEAELQAQLDLPAVIPYRDWDQGWDDWPPIFTPMYAMFHGSIGHTMETSHENYTGVLAHMATVMGALKFAAANQWAMWTDQVEVFRRGVEALPQQPIPDEFLNPPYTNYPQFDFVVEFPEAYVIPAVEPWQQDPHMARYLIDSLLTHGIRVEEAEEEFSLGDASFPEGTYIVPMQQGRRALAHTLLEPGWDISYDPGLQMYDISAWSLPLLWGVTRITAENPIDVETDEVDEAASVRGRAPRGRPAAYAYLPTTNAAIQATNDLLGRGVPLLRATEPFQDGGRTFGTGTFVLPASAPQASRWARMIALRYDLTVFGLDQMPDEFQAIDLPRIAVFADAGVRFALRDMGFSFDVVTVDDLNSGLSPATYDVFVHSGWSPLLWGSLSESGRDALVSFFAAGGNYLGIGRSGVDLAVEAGVAEVTFGRGERNDNGVVRVVYDSTDPVAAGYAEDGYAFMYGPVWFVEPLESEDVRVSARLAEGEFFVGGFWPGPAGTGREDAAGEPVVVWQPKGDSVVVLVGFHPTFRAHPLFTYRLVANALYLS